MGLIGGPGCIGFFKKAKLMGMGMNIGMMPEVVEQGMGPALGKSRDDEIGENRFAHGSF